MKEFYRDGTSFFMSIYELTQVPLAPEGSAPGEALGRMLCGLPAALSGQAQQAALELLCIAGTTRGQCIRHLLVLRSHDQNRQRSAARHNAMSRSLCGVLQQAGYRLNELPYEDYRRTVCPQAEQTVWALRKAPLTEIGLQGTYQSMPLIEQVDWPAIYAALDGSGCTFSVQCLPGPFTPAEKQQIADHAAACVRAAEGSGVPGLRDSLAAAAAARWQHLLAFAAGQEPAAAIDLLVRSSCGQSAAMLAAQVQQAVHPGVLEITPVHGLEQLPVYSQPWALRRQAGPPRLPDRWLPEEAARMLALPVQAGAFVGLPANAFSQMEQREPLPQALHTGFLLGQHVFSGQEVRLPPESFLLHTAILGKSGSRKTSLLKQLIHQFHEAGIATLILEPVKQEFRSLIHTEAGMQVFTVESPVHPLYLNPFRLPEGVTAGHYRSSLFSAFKAAVTLPDPLPALLQNAINEAYALYGWSDLSRSDDPNAQPFDLLDFIKVFKQVIRTSSYSAEVKGNMMSGGAFRLQSLAERCALTFDTIQATPVQDLLNGTVVLEMGALEPEQKCLVTALTLIRVLAVLKATRTSGSPLQNILILDEAHALLDQGQASTEEEKSLSSVMEQLLLNLITEMRAYGVGVLFADQTPSRIGTRLLDNVDNVLAFRLTGREAELLQSSLGAGEHAEECIQQLQAGEFLLSCHHLHTPLAMQAVPDANWPRNAEPVRDKALALHQLRSCAARGADSCPYAACLYAKCTACQASVRAASRMYAVQTRASLQLDAKTTDQLVSAIRLLPKVLHRKHPKLSPHALLCLCRCTAIQLNRLCGANGPCLRSKELGILLTEMNVPTTEGENEHG